MNRLPLTAAATVALALTGVTGLSAPAALAMDEQTKVVYSTTWQPGFKKGDDSRYYKLTKVPQDYDGTVLHYETSDTSKPGFTKAEDGGYYKLVEVPMEQPDQTLEVKTSDTWKPGYLQGDDGTYFKLVHHKK
jgi:hypothetical protein